MKRGRERKSRPRLRDRMSRTRAGFGRLRGRGALSDELWEDLEETLLLADVGLPTTAVLLEQVKARAAADKVRDADALPALLEHEITAVMSPDADRTLHRAPTGPSAWLLVGVNGVGKTTTIAKLAAQEIEDGNRVVLAAADTFRAAAADQLAHWADELGVHLVRAQEGADPGSVAFDAVEAAASRGADVVLVDTAGRLHTKANLMAELGKIVRVVERTPSGLHEVLLVLDATTGQNGLTQARDFTEAVGITGVVLTKLDGTAKGGIVIAIEHELGVPVKLVGIGETPDDLVPFDPAEFAAALVRDDTDSGGE
ncbi:MAG: signal recognition particle-docking protein FtsY [Acidimicrobiia bacterium]